MVITATYRSTGDTAPCGACQRALVSPSNVLAGLRDAQPFHLASIGIGLAAVAAAAFTYVQFRRKRTLSGARRRRRR